LDRESRFYLREDAGGVVLLGRLVQEFRADHLLDADAYVGFGQRPDDDFVALIGRNVQQRIPALSEGSIQRGWVGLAGGDA
jgi:glycine/D-amino acid oxidase-like deaminating enzyme